jgi:phosphate-selective porin OprO and OprP
MKPITVFMALTNIFVAYGVPCLAEDPALPAWGQNTVLLPPESDPALPRPQAEESPWTAGAWGGAEFSGSESEGSPVFDLESPQAPITSENAHSVDSPFEEPIIILEAEEEIPVETATLPEGPSASIEQTLPDPDLFVFTEEPRTPVRPVSTPLQAASHPAPWTSSLSSSNVWNLNVEGRAMLDGVAFSQSDVNRTEFQELTNYAELRSVRLGINGVYRNTVDFRLQLDAEDEFGSISVSDAWLGVSYIPLFGRVKIGQARAPFGMEQYAELQFATFGERSMASELFGTESLLGIQQASQLFDEQLLFQSGIYFHDDIMLHKETPLPERRFASSDSTGFQGGFRAVWTPLYERNGRRLVHLGGGWRYDDPGSDTALNFEPLGVRPNIHEMTPFLETGPDFLYNEMNAANVELALVRGSFGVQSELFTASYAGARYLPFNNPSDVQLHGAYVQASWIMSGEHREYDRATGTFGRIRPRRDFAAFNNGVFGLGAWETAVRWDYVDTSDLADDQFADHAGSLQSLTVGLNWYWNPYTRFMVNYVHARPLTHSPGGADVASTTDMMLMRLQFDW